MGNFSDKIVNYLTTRDWGKIAIYLLVILGLVVSALFIFWLRDEITVIFLYSYFRDKLVSLGLNIWIAKLIGLPMAVWVLYVTILLFSRDKEKKNKGYVFGAASWAVWCLCMFFATRDQMFDPNTGEATKCYSKTLSGYREVPCEWKYDPVFGGKVFRGDQSIALTEWIQRHGPVPVEKINPDKSMAFFSLEGEPLYWYYEQPNGTIDLFDHPGRHPQFNTELHPINSEIVAKIFQQLDAQRQIPTNIVIHNQDAPPGSTGTPDQGLDLNHLKELSDTLKSLQK